MRRNIPEVTPRLSVDDIEMMLLHIIRLPNLFIQARNQLKPEHFDNRVEIEYAVLWRAVLTVSSKSANKLPENGAVRRLSAEIKRMLNINPDLLITEQLEDLIDNDNGFVPWIYSVAENELFETEGRTLLETFLRERTVIDPLKQFINDIGDANPININNMLNSIKEQQLKIQTVRKDPIQVALPDNWEIKPIELTPIHVPFLDAYMGGQANGEAYGILGPTGVGKTTLGIMIAVEGALYQQIIAPSDSEMRHWYFFTFESSVDPEIRSRVISYAAKIDRNVLMKGEKLSTSDTLKKYELERWRDNLKAGQKMPGETERYEAVKPKLQRNLWLVDMSGSDPDNPSVGSGGVEEIADLLAMEADKGKRIGGVVIDYVGIAVKRQLDAAGIAYDQLRHYVGGYGDKVRRLISAQFKCPAWLLHQFTGEVNKRAPTAKMHHADAAEAKNFADNLWYCFNLGTKSNENVCQMTCTKERRSFSNGHAPLIKIDGAVCAMLPADELYTISGNQIVPKNFAEKVVSAIPIAIKKNRPNPAGELGLGSR